MNETTPQTQPGAGLPPVKALLLASEANKVDIDRAIDSFQRTNGYLSDKRTLRILFLATSLLQARLAETPLLPPEEISEQELRDVAQEAS